MSKYVVSHQGKVDHPPFPDVHDADGRQELVLTVNVLHLAADALEHGRHGEGWNNHYKGSLNNKNRLKVVLTDATLWVLRSYVSPVECKAFMYKP